MTILNIHSTLRIEIEHARTSVIEINRTLLAGRDLFGVTRWEV